MLTFLWWDKSLSAKGTSFLVAFAFFVCSLSHFDAVRLPLCSSLPPPHLISLPFLALFVHEAIEIIQNQNEFKCCTRKALFLHTVLRTNKRLDTVISEPMHINDWISKQTFLSHLLTHRQMNYFNRLTLYWGYNKCWCKYIIRLPCLSLRLFNSSVCAVFADMNSEANAALTDENKRLRQQMEEMRVCLYWPQNVFLWWYCTFSSFFSGLIPDLLTTRISWSIAHS